MSSTLGVHSPQSAGLAPMMAVEKLRRTGEQRRLGGPSELMSTVTPLLITGLLRQTWKLDTGEK